MIDADRFSTLARAVKAADIAVAIAEVDKNKWPERYMVASAQRSEARKSFALLIIDAFDAA